MLIVAGAVSAGIAHADPVAPPAPKTTIGADGTYAVGKDIAPGNYSSTGPVGDGACYWKRLNGDSIVDSAMSRKPQVVQIDATDTAFKTSGCQPWQPADCSVVNCAPPQMAPQDVLGQLGRMLLTPH